MLLSNLLWKMMQLLSICSNILNLKSNNFLFLSCTEFLLGIACALGDYYVFKSMDLINLFLFKNLPILNETLIRAMLDNFIHGLVGCLSWAIVAYPYLNVCELTAAWIFASILDIDHFISARSFRVAEAIALEKRPFLHNSLTLFIINLFFLAILTLFNSNKKYAWSSLLFLSWFSHHLRDGTRRGLWLGSIGNISPLNYKLYLLVILIMPLIFRIFNFNNVLKMFAYQQTDAQYRINSHIVWINCK